MIARLRARLHGLRRGHQVYEDTYLVTIPVSIEEDPTYVGQVHRCHGCDRRWVT